MSGINKIIVILFWAALGFIIAGIGFCWGEINFTTEFSILDAIELLLTIGILFYLQNVISSRGIVERVEKDLIIERLRWISQKLLYFQEFCQREISTPSEQSVRSTITTDIRAVESALMEVSIMLEATPLKINKEDYDIILKGTKKIRASLIGGSFPRKNLDEKTNRLVSHQISARLTDLQKFIVHVNRS